MKLDNSTQQLFGEKFLQLVQERTGRTGLTQQQAFDLFVSPDSKMQIWTDLAQMLGLDQKRVHDYFHNTWSKKFCDDMGDVKDDIQGLIEQNPGSSVTHILELIQAGHPGKRYHYQSLYQCISYKFKAYRSKFGDDSDKSPTPRRANARAPSVRSEQNESSAQPPDLDQEVDAPLAAKPAPAPAPHPLVQPIQQQPSLPDGPVELYYIGDVLSL